jgi:hypothetical protein
MNISYRKQNNSRTWATRGLKPLLLAMTLLLGAGQVAAAGGRPGAVRPSVTPLNTVETADVLFMREEEKLARDIYLQFDESWALAPFINIAGAEQHHMDSMLRLIQTYGLTDPAIGNALGEFSDPNLQALYDNLLAAGLEGPIAALSVGGLIEEVDIRDIQDAILRSSHADIDVTYQRLMCGSRNHLRAFVWASELLSGVPYTAQLLSQVEVDQIAQSPQERCGR